MPDQDNAQRDAATPPPVPPAPASVRGTCGNCGSPLLGKYCYACGQPVTGMVRHFSTILGDFTDTILNWDARLPRTLWPRSEEHTSELQSLMRISYAVFCLKKKKRFNIYSHK